MSSDLSRSENLFRMMEGNHLKKRVLGMRSKSCMLCFLEVFDHIEERKKKVIKGVWRMPWLLEAKKDVISCDKLGVLANTS
jgi:hypothetical protein